MHTQKHTHVCEHTQTHTHTHTYSTPHVHTRTHTHTHPRTHTRTHSHTHTHKTIFSNSKFQNEIKRIDQSIQRQIACNVYCSATIIHCIIYTITHGSFIIDLCI